MQLLLTHHQFLHARNSSNFSSNIYLLQKAKNLLRMNFFRTKLILFFLTFIFVLLKKALSLQISTAAWKETSPKCRYIWTVFRFCGRAGVPNSATSSSTSWTFSGEGKTCLVWFAVQLQVIIRSRLCPEQVETIFIFWRASREPLSAKENRQDFGEEMGFLTLAGKRSEAARF